eukprot:gene16670-22925_t
MSDDAAIQLHSPPSKQGARESSLESWSVRMLGTEDTTKAKSGKETRGTKWYVSEKDLAFYKETVAASGWQLIVDKTIPKLISYKAWRRILPVSPR